MSRYGLLALPVVNDEGRLLGLITHDDLVDATGLVIYFLIARAIMGL